MYRVELCASKAAYKIVPTAKVRLDLSALKSAYPVKIDADIALVITIQDVDVTVHSFGEIQFTQMCDRHLVETIAEHLYRYRLPV